MKTVLDVRRGPIGAHSKRDPAIDAVFAARPRWSRVIAARDAIDFGPRTLLHAGPPFRDPTRPSAPVLSSAVLAARYEGWCTTDEAAEAMVRSGAIRLQPAQSFGVVVPLAAVVSPRAALVEIDDAIEPTRRAWSLLPSGAGVEVRFGTRDPRVLERMALRDQVLAPAFAALLAEPLLLIPLARYAIDAGDDLHASTASATQALHSALTHRSSAAPAAVRVALEFLTATPLFFLTPWMAACALALGGAWNTKGSTAVAAMASNGEDFGIRIAALPDRWFVAPAPVPRGGRLPAADAEAIASAAVGDSPVIESLGLGGGRLHEAAAVREAFRSFLPADADARSETLFVRGHAELHAAGVLDARRVRDANVAPIVALAMLDAAGRRGLLGRGVIEAPLEPFREAACAVA